jgi:MerR family transcriptional regulator, Zn(II)-responsive regulator of zntA
MAPQRILVSDLAKRTGTTRKALGLYEAAGVIAPATRTPAGFTIAEIRDIVGIRRSGRTPCTHVRALIDAKLASIERALTELKATRDALAAMRKSWRTATRQSAAVCPHIERSDAVRERR